jgi:hypothetical protein
MAVIAKNVDAATVHRMGQCLPTSFMGQPQA